MNSNFPGSSARAIPGGQAGQAIVELVVGLIAIVVLFMGMLQIQRLAREHTQVLSAARQQAGQDALAGAYVLRGDLPKFIHDWQPGPDGAQYSQDDVAQLDNPGTVSMSIAQPARPADLAVYVPNNMVSQEANAGSVLTDFFFVHGHDQSTPVQFYPIIRSAVYGADEVTMQAQAWLTWTHIE